MTPEQQAAYVNAQAACAMAEMFAMYAANALRADRGQTIAYGEEDFMKLQEKYCIGHNAVIGFYH